LDLIRRKSWPQSRACRRRPPYPGQRSGQHGLSGARHRRHVWRYTIPQGRASSLQPHHRNGNEIVFRHSKIVLNIHDALHSPEIITLATEKLFSCSNSGLRSACLYWKDRKHAIHTIGFESIIGCGERASTMDYVQWICNITLPQLPENLLKRNHQQAFEQRIRPGVRPTFEPKVRGVCGKFLGWELGSY
jgi:hypothetical protein